MSDESKWIDEAEMHLKSLRPELVDGLERVFAGRLQERVEIRKEGLAELRLDTDEGRAMRDRALVALELGGTIFGCRNGSVFDLWVKI